jgi:hypothetical protein
MHRYQLSPTVERQLLAAVRSGVYPHVAAAAVGVPRQHFLAWMRSGRVRARGRCRQLWLEVCEARAFARMRAEVEARQKDVKFWLRYGPGKDGPRPAWMSARKPTGGPRPEHLANLQAVVDGLLEALGPYPEARQAVLQSLETTPPQLNRD